jgi:uncharacterized protein YozE (UPF0346 family)
MQLPPPNSRVAFIGPTRSGKTFLARQWLMHYKNVIVIDPKQQFSWQRPGDKRFARKAKDFKELVKLLNLSAKDGYPIIYQPDLSALDPDSSYDLDRVYELAFHRGNTLVYIDELYFLANGSDFAKRAPWFFRCVVAGASKGVGVWSAYQRPSWVPLIAMTETEVRAIFYLRIKDDRSRIDSSFGEMPWQQLRDTQHGFCISTDRWTSPVMRARLASKKEDPPSGSTDDAPISPSSNTS